MKKIKIPVILYLAFAGMAAASVAQSPSPASAHAGDPFVRKQDAPPAAEAENPVNICFTVEIYAVSQTDAAKLLEENPDGETRHARVLELAAAGKVRLETLLSNVTKSGLRSVLDQCDEVRYSTEWEPSNVPSEPQSPNAYETRNAGDHLEFEPVLSPDKSVCDINMSLTSMRFHGFSDIRTRADGPPVAAQPQFESRKVTTSMALIPGKMQFLGTLSAPPQFADTAAGSPASQEVRLAFGRISLNTIIPAASPVLEENATLEHQLVFYSLDREAARQVLAGDPKPGGYYDAVRTLVDKQQARLERITVLKTKSGQRAVVEEVDEVRYFTEYYQAAPGTGGKTPASPDTEGKTVTHTELLGSSFETRDAGLTLEIEPVVRKSIVDLNLAPQLVHSIGNLQANGVAGKYPPQPVFEDAKVTTSLSAPPGEYAFISTFSPAGDTGVNGKKDTGKVWFAFIRTTLAKP